MGSTFHKRIIDAARASEAGCRLRVFSGSGSKAGRQLQAARPSRQSVYRPRLYGLFTCRLQAAAASGGGHAAVGLLWLAKEDIVDAQPAVLRPSSRHGWKGQPSLILIDVASARFAPMRPRLRSRSRTRSHLSQIGASARRSICSRNRCRLTAGRAARTASCRRPTACAPCASNPAIGVGGHERSDLDSLKRHIKELEDGAARLEKAAIDAKSANVSRASSRLSPYRIVCNRRTFRRFTGDPDARAAYFPSTRPHTRFALSAAQSRLSGTHCLREPQWPSSRNPNCLADRFRRARCRPSRLCPVPNPTAPQSASPAVPKTNFRASGGGH